MASQKISFSGSTAATINKLSRVIKEVDTSAPASLRDYRRYLYLVERLGNEMKGQVNFWKTLDPRCSSDSSIVADVDNELGIPPHCHQNLTPPQQVGAVYGGFPEMPPSRPFAEWARRLDFVPPSQYTATPSSPPRSAARPEHRVSAGSQEEHAYASATQEAQRVRQEAGIEGRDAYLGSSQDTAVDYPSSQPGEDE